MSELVSATGGRRRLQTSVLGASAGAALFLAITGLYGVVTYSVRRRRQEIGIRLALGAQSTDILKSVLLRGIRLTAAGLVLGLLAATALTRFLTSMLYGITPADPATLAAVGLLLLATAPARLGAPLPPRHKSCPPWSPCARNNSWSWSGP